MYGCDLGENAGRVEGQISVTIGSITAQNPGCCPQRQLCFCWSHVADKHGVQFYFSLNKDKKTRLIYLGDKKVDRARKYSDNYKMLLELIEKMTILNMKLIKEEEVR